MSGSETSCHFNCIKQRYSLYLEVVENKFLLNDILKNYIKISRQLGVGEA